MPARLVQVTLVNNSDFPITWLDDQRPHGDWQQPWYPSNVSNLMKGQQASWRLESGSPWTGVEGRALFKIDVPFAGNVGVQTEFINFWWERPFIGHFKRNVLITLQDPRTNDPPHPAPALTFLKDHQFRGTGGSGSFIDSAISSFFVPITTPVILYNEAQHHHIWWVVEVLNSGTSSRLPLQAVAQNVIYALMDNGDLLWDRHDGQGDGSFTWASNEGKKVGNGWNAKQVFSG